jgi:hypothetical protein
MLRVTTCAELQSRDVQLLGEPPRKAVLRVDDDRLAEPARGRTDLVGERRDHVAAQRRPPDAGREGTARAEAAFHDPPRAALRVDDRHPASAARRKACDAARELHLPLAGAEIRGCRNVRHTLPLGASMRPPPQHAHYLPETTRVRLKLANGLDRRAGGGRLRRRPRRQYPPARGTRPGARMPGRRGRRAAARRAARGSRSW